MAITQAILTSGSDTDQGGSSTTSSFTTTANRLVLLCILSEGSATPNISPGNANGLTWVNMFDANIFGASGLSRFGMWRAMASSGATGTMAISCDVGPVIHWELVEFDGVDTSGTNGSGAIVQTAAGFSNTPPTLSFALTATGASNAVFGFQIAHDSTVVVGPGAGFTTLTTGTLNGAGSGDQYLLEWLNASSVSSISFAFDSGSSEAFGVEILAGGGSSVPTTGSPSGLVCGAGF